jgi:plastocyanin
MRALYRVLTSSIVYFAFFLCAKTVHAAETKVTWDFTVAPNPVNINVGDSVRWEGNLGFHPLAESNASFTTVGTVLASSGTSFTRTFAAPGTYYFICAAHSSMRLTVNVTNIVCNPPTNPTRLDIDGNGEISATTDGVLVLRYLLGLRGAALTDGAVGSCPGRTDAAIETYLQGLMTQ